MKKFGDMTIPELRLQLKKRNAKQDGRKNDLIERLEAYQRNSDFGQNAVTEPEFCLQTPEASIYRDINMDSPLPVITGKMTATYLQVEGVSIKKISKDLYEERYLSFCRWAPGIEGYYIRAKCYAQMKAGTSYLIDIELDNNGDIVAAQCECAAGMGPDARCKHVVTVLFGLSVYRKDNCLKTEQTCTQQLQQFHAVKRNHAGSPVKAANMKLPFGDKTVFDPRPENRRNCPNYNATFMNSGKPAQVLEKDPFRNCSSLQTSEA